jgi:antitoxin (DNA-binding transcriptional repressor) of toxin-antitoxin stability system
MNTVTATRLKRRLGEVLDAVSFGPVAVERHGKVVAYLVSPSVVSPPKPSPNARRPDATTRWGRRGEERVAELCAARDFRPSRWARAGDPWFLAGVAAMLASLPQFDRPRMLALAERLHPGMSGKVAFARWLAEAPLDPARFLPQLRARMEMDLEAAGA